MIFKRMEKFVYNYSDAVTTIDEVFANTIRPRFKDDSNLKVIPNFVDTDIYKTLSINDLVINRNIFPKSDSLKLMYAGNIGYAQSWDTFLALAVSLKNENIEFYIIGEGAMKEFIKQQIIKNTLEKVHLLPYQSRFLIPILIAYSDIQFIFMSPRTEQDGFPSKVYTIMACERPLLVCSGANTPIVNFLYDKNCAFIVTEKDMTKKINIVKDILLNINKKKLEEMGQNGLEFIYSNYSKTIVTKQYVNLINSLLNVKSDML